MKKTEEKSPLRLHEGMSIKKKFSGVLKGANPMKKKLARKNVDKNTTIKTKNNLKIPRQMYKKMLKNGDRHPTLNEIGHETVKEQKNSKFRVNRGQKKSKEDNNASIVSMNETVIQSKKRKINEKRDESTRPEKEKEIGNVRVASVGEANLTSVKEMKKPNKILHNSLEINPKNASQLSRKQRPKLKKLCPGNMNSNSNDDAKTEKMKKIFKFQRFHQKNGLIQSEGVNLSAKEKRKLKMLNKINLKIMADKNSAGRLNQKSGFRKSIDGSSSSAENVVGKLSQKKKRLLKLSKVPVNAKAVVQKKKPSKLKLNQISCDSESITSKKPAGLHTTNEQMKKKKPNKRQRKLLKLKMLQTNPAVSSNENYVKKDKNSEIDISDVMDCNETSLKSTKSLDIKCSNKEKAVKKLGKKQLKLSKGASTLSKKQKKVFRNIIQDGSVKELSSNTLSAKKIDTPLSKGSKKKKLQDLLKDMDTTVPSKNEKDTLFNLKQKRKLEGNLSHKKTELPTLKEQMSDLLKSSRFRWLNEQLYTSQSDDAIKFFKDDPQAYEAYHSGYRKQVEKWPLNPLNWIIKSLLSSPPGTIIADMGCGEAQLAESLPQFKVHSFDFVSSKPGVVACDMAHTPLLTESVDIVVFCLSLMGTNLNDFILESNRVLKVGGILKIAEVESRFEDIDNFTSELKNFGFQLKKKDYSQELFYFMDFKKVHQVSKSNKLPVVKLDPCLYKKR